MVIDQLPGQVEDALRGYAPVQQVGHPLLEHRRLADPPAPGNRVDPRLIHRQASEQGVAVRDGQAAELSELGVKGAEQLRIFEMDVVRREAGISSPKSCDSRD